MNISRCLARTSAVVALGTLAACGGGGGGGGGDGGGGGGSAPLSYSGNSSPAAITVRNAGAITASVVSSGDTSSAIPTASLSATPAAQVDGMIDIGRRLHRSVRGSFAQPLRAGASRQGTLAIAIDEPLDCDSGSGRISGTLNDNGTGTVSVQYNGCRIDGTTTNGSATFRIDAFDFFFGFTDFTFSFTRLTLRGAVAADLTGSIRSRLDIPTRSETITENVVALFPSGIMTKSENLVYVDVYNDLFSPTSYTESVSGRVYHSVDGWVDVSTIVPLVFGTLTQEFPQSGLLQLTGAGGAAIRVTANSAISLSLALDLDGNSVFERVVTLAWTDLSGPAGSDLGDDDIDGLHNSWELANGLNPSSAVDAAFDSDGDAFSNVVEYQAGSNPRSASSTPRTARLSVVTSASPDPVAVGGDLTYQVQVMNNTGVEASNVVLVNALPAGVSLVSASTTQGSCTGTGTVTCNLGTLNGSVVLFIVVRPSAPGVITHTATVTTSSSDLGSHDNRSITTTTAGTLVSGLQARIDAAVNGDTVLVGPGIHLGGLNFNGKNIVLQSTDGPATTIIHGNRGVGGGVGVRMGPGGTIRGFTITGALAVFGGGIEVVGSGSVISENVFEGNVQSSGGFGAAIGGNVASPTIERNVFRNNVCHPAFSGSVVAFVNGSSPQILSNIFENNPCDAINLTLPSLTTPRVMNNTFVGNHVAIRFNRAAQGTQVYRNNIIVHNGTGVHAEFGTDADNPVWTNNLVFGNTLDYQGLGNLTGIGANISVIPSFVNQAAGNYDLQPGSPAIGAGSPTDAPASDFDGVARGASIDIGAFEGP